MIIDIKKTKHGYKVKEYIKSSDKVKKYNINHNDLIVKLNDISFDENFKNSLLLEKTSYNLNRIDCLSAKSFLLCFLSIMGVILLYPSPFISLILLGLCVFRLSSSVKELVSIPKEITIFEKFELYCDNLDLIDSIKKSNNKQNYDGSVLGLYFNGIDDIRHIFNEQKRLVNCENSSREVLGICPTQCISLGKEKKLIHRKSVK